MLVLLAGWLAAVRADTVRLKNGETYEGSILSETNATVSIEVEQAGGTILTTRTFRRDQIAEIRRSTPEDIAQRNMERAFARTQRYRLDPNTSYSPEYYRLVIDGVLKKFLADYPDSPYTNVVAAQLRQWMAEQGTVSSGMAKFNGKWMSAAGAAGVATAATAETAAGSAARTDVLSQVGDLLSRYWVIGLVAVVLLAWGCVYIFTRE
jgi:hypothetical protein